MKKTTLITGGAGFIGCNLVDRCLTEGHHVTLFDNLSRRGSEHNLAWLKSRHRDSHLLYVHGDVRNAEAVRRAAAHAETIYHLAAQVAVTTSVAEPREDFEINALGTFNVLEAARLNGRQPAVVYTSTNKVYGSLVGTRVEEKPTRHILPDLPEGVAESYPLDFHSPYGCSKGAMDQYVRDYARIYNLPTVVFRMSCIYGPRQFGNEDQGWLAHMLIHAAIGSSLTIYGDGKQVRDVLFIDDLVRALRLAVEKIDKTRGDIFNIGGGPTNTISIWAEFKDVVETLAGRRISVSFDKPRPGDQPCYVSDIRKAARVMGWRPEVGTDAGIARLWAWIRENESVLRTFLRAMDFTDTTSGRLKKERAACASS
ncbi:MAG: SDR family NAD(P)-dependent oxidoreductase [Planctomycetes bacterium]|nr:SDR family NAD(P)-dependent oxidoreductase [Planctomycetota bacterium]